MLSTQFQPCDARRAFPCFDEPALKASFELSIEIPDDQTALSNNPVTNITLTSRSGGTEGWKWKVVTFEKTPVMSTYLYTWAVGDFGLCRSRDGAQLRWETAARQGVHNKGSGRARTICSRACVENHRLALRGKLIEPAYARPRR